jgi:anti-sigma factor RsiW
MNNQFQQDHILCPSPEISAYLDGELAPHEEIELEIHMASCGVCKGELNMQKNLLHALTSSLETTREFELPKNFTKTIVANAESNVSGLRRPKERLNAIFICSALFLFALFALGSDAEKTFAAISSVVEKVSAVAGSILHFFYDISLGTAVITRSLSSTFVLNSPVLLFAVFGLFAFSLFVFSRLVLRSQRA